MDTFAQLIDQLLIKFYRFTGNAGVDFVLGTFILVCLCMLIGEITLAVVFKLSRRHIEKHVQEATDYQDLSVSALKAGNKEAYRAADKLAKEAFGQTFFQQMALSAAFLWPVCFALGWMQQRFLDMEFPIPGTGWSMGFIGPFVIIYVATYFLIKWVKRGLRLSSRIRSRAAAASSLTPAAPGLSPLPPPLKTPEEK